MEHAKVDRDKNLAVKEETEKRIEENGDRALLILGDFNGHPGMLGNHRLNYNGKFVMDLITNYSLILLNTDQKCKGMYTRGRDNQKSVTHYPSKQEKV